MTKENKLKLEMSVFFLFVFVAFGSIIAIEKLAPINNKKIQKKLESYINKNYKKEKENFDIGDIKYKNTKYELKVYNKDNHKLYFTLFYNKNRKIESTYKKDYLEGNNYLKYLNKKLTNEINKKKHEDYEVKFDKLNSYNKYNKEKIINEKNLLNSNLYNLNIEYVVKDYNEKEIKEKIIKTNTKLIKNKINPDKYIFTIYSEKDNKNELIIKNLNQEIINSNEFNQIISDIINKRNTNLIKNHKIKYNYKGE